MRLLASFFILTVLLLFWGAGPVHSESKGLVVVYSANTFGKHTPCPT